MSTGYYEFPRPGLRLPRRQLRLTDQRRTPRDLEAVLTEQHPRYHNPLPGEQYCYAYADLIFTEVREVRWLKRSHQVYTDATGEEDLGNIDTMIYDDGHYDLTGGWGQVWIVSRNSPGLAFA